MFFKITITALQLQTLTSLRAQLGPPLQHRQQDPQLQAQHKTITSSRAAISMILRLLAMDAGALRIGTGLRLSSWGLGMLFSSPMRVDVIISFG